MNNLITENIITLFVLDTRMLANNGQLFYFTSAEDFNTVIRWQGNEYTPIPMEASGFEMDTKGTLPNPSVSISNLFGAGNLLLTTYKGLLGADLHRIVTLRRFLDDGATPDPGAFISYEMFVVAQKTSHNAATIVFKLAAKWDQEGTMLPRRQILRDICPRTYRFWDPNIGSFNYSKATCPYTGSGFWDPSNTPTSPQLDQCSRTMVGCSLRFGGGNLPAWFFPGVGKVK